MAEVAEAVGLAAGGGHRFCCLRCSLCFWGVLALGWELSLSSRLATAISSAFSFISFALAILYILSSSLKTNSVSVPPFLAMSRTELHPNTSVNNTSGGDEKKVDDEEMDVS